MSHTDKRSEAKKAYLGSTKSFAQVAADLGLSDRTLIRWSNADPDGRWPELREKLHQGIKAEQSPKVVEFAPRTPEFRSEPTPQPRRRRRDGEEIDLLEVVESAIASGSALIETASDTNDTKGFGGVAGGLCRLIELRLKLKPVEETALIEQLLERGLTPRELVKRLREAGWVSQG